MNSTHNILKQKIARIENMTKEEALEIQKKFEEKYRNKIQPKNTVYFINSHNEIEKGVLIGKVNDLYSDVEVPIFDGITSSRIVLTANLRPTFDECYQMLESWRQVKYNELPPIKTKNDLILFMYNHSIKDNGEIDFTLKEFIENKIYELVDDI